MVKASPTSLESSRLNRLFPSHCFADRGVVLSYFNANDEVAGSIPASNPQGCCSSVVERENL